MDLRYINPFVASAVAVIKEAVGLIATKKKIFIAKGKDSLGGVTIFFNITGDVEGQIIFDLPPGIATIIAEEMVGLNLKEIAQDAEQKELFKSAITELGNMISGTAITKLEEHKFNCDITPPLVYVGAKTKITHSSMTTIVIELNTQVGDFSINLVNKKELYLDNVIFFLVGLDQHLTNDIVNQFVQKGFYIHKGDQYGDDPFLKEKKVDFILIDTDFCGEDFESVVKKLREVSASDKTRVITYSSKKEREFLLKIQKLAVSGLILKSLTPEQMMDKLVEILNRLGVKQNERRKQVIVKVSSHDKFTINIKLPSVEQPISPVITEIGVGGVTLAFNDGEILKHFQMHMDLKEIQLSLRGKYLLTDGVVSVVKAREITIRFTALKEKFVHILSQAIFEKISPQGLTN